MKILSFTLFLILTLAIQIISQQNNYWDLQYGTRSTLLGGTVIGSVSDLSATYYNPGAIALFKDLNLILSAQAYQLDKYVLGNGTGEGKDLEYSSINPSAPFAAINLPFKFLKNDRMIFSILTRESTQLQFENRIIDSVDAIPSSPGKEDFAGGIDYNLKVSDVWGGITYSTKLNEIIGFGVTGYVAVRNYTNQNLVILQALKDNGEIGSLNRVYNYNYINWRTLLKAGIGFNLNPLTAGITITTPSLNMLGNGAVGTHLFISDIDTSNTFISNYQDDIKSEYKTSWAAGIGAAYRLDKLKFHFSAEWFNAVKEYYVLDTQPFYAQSSGNTLTNDLTHQTKSLINFGFGVDFFGSDSLIFSASIITDYSAKSGQTKPNQPQSIGMDLYHISGGSTFKIWSSFLTLGLVYTFGSQNVDEQIDLSNVGNAKLSNETSLKYSQVKVIVGFEF